MSEDQAAEQMDSLGDFTYSVSEAIDHIGANPVARRPMVKLFVCPAHAASDCIPACWRLRCAVKAGTCVLRNGV